MEDPGLFGGGSHEWTIYLAMALVLMGGALMLAATARPGATDAAAPSRTRLTWALGCLGLLLAALALVFWAIGRTVTGAVGGLL